jgi:predicted CoA-substrate-specific enzyme activase
MSKDQRIIAGIDVGTECVKAVVLDLQGAVRGRSLVTTRGDFNGRAKIAMEAALYDAGIDKPHFEGVCSTGFGRDLVESATQVSSSAVCHAAGAYSHFAEAMSVVDIGGREPRLIHVNANGLPYETYTVRRCAIGIGTFLVYAARHLDVHPTQLQELAEATDRAAPIGSFCSIIAGSELLERLREGCSREEVARGCIRSIAERITEIEGLREPLRITGGVPEYYPGVLDELAELTQLRMEPVPEPIMAGALGAAIVALTSILGGAVGPLGKEP